MPSRVAAEELAMPLSRIARPQQCPPTRHISRLDVDLEAPRLSFQLCTVVCADALACSPFAVWTRARIAVARDQGRYDLSADISRRYRLRGTRLSL